MDATSLQSYRWLFRDKYRLPESKIEEILQDLSLAPPGFRADVLRLKVGEPIQYVIGWVPFLGCEIDLSFKPLIPRPETEFWTGQVIEEIHKRVVKGDQVLEILDLCCGSGCIGIAFLKHLPNVRVDFADIQEDAIRQTRLNLENNKIDDSRWQIFHSDLFVKVSDSQY